MASYQNCVAFVGRAVREARVSRANRFFFITSFGLGFLSAGTNFHGVGAVDNTSGTRAIIFQVSARITMQGKKTRFFSLKLFTIW